MKTFCPNCEKDTKCEHTAELYECCECGEDFAKYIVGRNKQSNSDVSTTQDVLTTIKTSFDLEDMRYYADRHRGKYVLSGPHWSSVLRFPILFDQYEKTLARAEAAEAEVKQLREETTIKQEGSFIVCQKCRSIVPPQIMKYQMCYCPNCGRKITEKGGAE